MHNISINSFGLSHIPVGLSGLTFQAIQYEL